MRTYHALKHVDGKDCEGSCSSAAPGQSRSVGKERMMDEKSRLVKRLQMWLPYRNSLGHGGGTVDKLTEMLADLLVVSTASVMQITPFSPRSLKARGSDDP